MTPARMGLMRPRKAGLRLESAAALKVHPPVTARTGLLGHREPPSAASKWTQAAPCTAMNTRRLSPPPPPV